MRRAIWIVVLSLVLQLPLTSGGVPRASARVGGPVRPAPAGIAPTPDAQSSLPAALWAGRQAPAVPDVLRPWIPWVLHDQEEALCPRPLGEDDSDEKVCAWPARLRLELRAKGGGFVSVIRAFRRMSVALPGSGKHWPQDVRVDGQPAVVLAKEGASGEDAQPEVQVAAGTHTITGTFQWDELPESLDAPRDVGILTLFVGGQQILHPNRDDDGRVFLQKEEGEDSEQEDEALDVSVSRRLEDGVPIQLRTRIELRVSGKRREVLFERVLPDKFVPMRIDSELPARLESTGTLRIQVRPGTHVLTVTARHPGPVAEIRRPQPPARWPADEAWVFEAAPAIRIVTVEGVESIDPQQTTVPADWRKLPCYAVHPGDAVRLVTQRLGDSQPLADELHLSREIFLDFDGNGFTTSDRVSGTLHRAWRIEVQSGTELGRVAVGGKDQLVTIGKQSGRAGVELRQGQLLLSADSRIPYAAEISAVSWNADFREVRSRLHLPPGWQLFHASGADDIPGTWLRRYRLMSLFLTLLAAMGVWRLFGGRWAALTIVGLLLACPVSEVPHVAVLAVLMTEALLRVLPDGKARSVISAGHWLTRVAMVLALIGFATTQLRHGLYPAVERRAAQELVFDAPEEEKPDAMQVQVQAQAPSSVFAQQSGLGQAKQDAMGGLVGPGTGGGGVDSDGIAIDQEDRKEKPKESKEGIVRYAKREQAAPEPMLMAIEDLRQQRQSSLSYGSAKLMPGKKSAYRNRNVNFEIDPKAVVQTGPGLPRWSWNSHSLSFSGRVERAQMLRLWLIPPWLNLILSLLQVSLIGLLGVRLCGVGLSPDALWRGLRGPGRTQVAAVLLLFACVLGPQSARAELPSDELLSTLKDRLLKEPDCMPHCAASSRLFLEAQGKLLRLRMEVSAAAQTAIPLPGSASQWLPEQVLLDGVPATALAQREGGHLYLVVPAGNHQVILEGRLPARPTVQLELPLLPRRVEARVEGWELAGLHEDGIADENLQLSRIEKDGKDSETPTQLQQGTLPPLVRVARSIQIGMQWEVETQVSRLTPVGSAVVLEVPLLPGEQVTSPEVRVQNRKVLVNMGPSETSFVWRSSLQETDNLELQATSLGELVEQWTLLVSPMFHAELSGIAPLHPERAETAREPVWRPWPGEKVGISVSRPAAKSGATLTIDLARLELRPGLRATDAKLKLRIRTSRGGQHVIKLPEGATVEALSADGSQRPVQQQGRELTLQLVPGSQQLDIAWSQPGGQALRFLSPDIDLGAAMVNAEINLHLGDGRWVLLCTGPRLGPAVLFWGELVILILLSLLLGRVPCTPLRAQHWLLIGLGLLQVPLFTGATVLGWFLALGYRQSGPELRHFALFNLRQIVLVIWTLMMVLGLLEAIRVGLTVSPEMAIVGNGSHGGQDALLRWYADRADRLMPQAVVWSLPVLAYKLFMLLWSLLLAVNLVGYLPWAYRAFSEWGLWRPMPPLFRRKSKSSESPAPQADAADVADAAAAATAAAPAPGAVPAVPPVAVPEPLQPMEQDQTLPQKVAPPDPHRK